MADTKIEYLTKTWNPIQTVIKGESGQGYHCTRIDDGCRNCWAEVMNTRIGNHLPFDAKEYEYELKPGELNKPFGWKKRQVIGVQFMGDLFHKDIPFKLINKVFDNICTDMVRKCKHKDCELTEECFRSVTKHDYLILTKRPERISLFIDWVKKWGDIDYPFALEINENKGISNIWWGTSISDQKSADIRIPELLKIKSLFPKANLWLSVEPLISAIDLTLVPGLVMQFGCGQKHHGIGTPECPKELHHHHDDRCYYPINWVVCGGESGKKARPTHPDWVRKVRDVCQNNNVKFFFKQWGEYLHISQQLTGGIGKYYNDEYTRCGKEKAGHLLDGNKYLEMPEGLRL